MKSTEDGGISRERHIAIRILDEVEEMLEEHNITIPSDDREDYGGDENLKESTQARLFGTEYYLMEDAITTIMEEELA